MNPETMHKSDIQKSKFLSLILRHNPSIIGVELDENGWVRIDELSAKSKLSRTHLSVEQIRDIALRNEKKRFTISDDGLFIRAAQGHSIDIDLGLTPTEPPDILFHGTAEKFLDQIRFKGLLPMSRDFVHLSKNRETAVKVGSRHGKPSVISVSAKEMAQKGHEFFLAENGVWLIKLVPSEFLKFESNSRSSAG